MSAILQTLLVNNTELRKKTIDIIGKFFKNPMLIEMGLIDFLMNCLNENTGIEALDLLYQMQKVNENYNKDLDIIQFSITDRDLIANNEKIMNSLFLRFFPTPYVKIIMESEDPKQVLQIYLKDNIEESALIWSKGMRELLENILCTHLASFKEPLGKFVDSKIVGSRKIGTMPVYTNIFKGIIKYPQIEKEVCCAEYYLRVWNNLKLVIDKKLQSNFIKSLKLTFDVVTTDINQINLKDLEIVLNSYKFSSMMYIFFIIPFSFSEKSAFPCFDKLLQVLWKVSKNLDNLENKTHLKNFIKFCCRIVN